MDRLKASQVFVEVVERGSLSQAALTLDMSHAMVSRYLAEMESWLGTRLLHRTTRKIALTDAGEGALASAKLLLELAGEMQTQAQRSALLPAGRLRLTAPASFAEAQLTDALTGFLARHPQIQLELIVSDRFINMIDERIDIAIRISNSPDPGLIGRRLADCASLLVASPDYLKQCGEPRHPDELTRHKFLSHQFVSKRQLLLENDGKMHTVLLTPVFSSNETVVLRRAAVSGVGIAMLPAYYIQSEITSGQLVPVLSSYKPEILGIHALYLSRRHQALALRCLLDYLVTHFAQQSVQW